MNEHCVALLGRRDDPTDAVEEYCRYLGTALQPRGVSLELARMRWAELGWRGAFAELRRQATPWKSSWVLLQYTALAWSRRGFSLRVRGVLRQLKKSGARTAIVFHDTEPYFGSRLIDRIRRIVQLYSMCEAVRLSDLAVFTIPVEKIGWLPAACAKAVFIPVGANLPSPERVWIQRREEVRALTVAVFCLSDGRAREGEVACVAKAVRYAAERVGAIRVALLGRNSERAERQLRESIGDAPVKIYIHGLLDGEEVVRVLGSADVLLFARGAISTGRSSAIAGIACGLPVIAREGPETTAPITGAGVVLLPEGAGEEFGAALVRVLSDGAYRATLAERSHRAQEQHFSWSAIAAKYAAALRSRSVEK